MIGVKVQGRLGNQLFQYAFAFATAKKNNSSFYLDQNNTRFIAIQYFKIPLNTSLFLQQLVFNRLSFKFSVLERFYYNTLSKCIALNNVCIPVESVYNDYEDLLKDQTLFEGFFLSPNFFKDYAKEVKHLFSVKNKYVKTYQRKYGHIFNQYKIATVHVRRSDYLNLGNFNLGNDDLTVPIEYYHQVIKSISDKDVLFVFISDDIEFIKKEFAYVENKLISDDDLINDFQHLLNAEICVTANSTFSWWGAWLNAHPQKKVYAPKYFLGHFIKTCWPPEIYPDDWILVDTD